MSIFAFKNFPTTIKVGSVPIAVEFCDDVAEDSAWGNYHPSNYRIRLREEMPFPAKAVEIVLHEIFHAIFHCADLNDKDDEERTVSVFSTWVTMVLMDNPMLVKWLANITKTS